jgi:hypothetical protein
MRAPAARLGARHGGLQHAAGGHLEALLGAREEVDGQKLQPRDQLLSLQHLRAGMRAWATLRRLP